jgi:outer membrane protein TolC
MMRIAGSLAASLGCVALLGAPCSRAETLAEAWALALQHDQQLAALQTRATSAADEVSAARAQRLPSVTTGASFLQFADAPAFQFSAAGPSLPEIVDGDNAGLASVSASVPLYTSGRVAASIEAAQSQRSAADAVLSRAAQDLKLGVVRNYVAVLRAQRALRVVESSVEALEAYERDARAMFDRETVPRNDLLAASVALANERQRAIRAAHADKLARAGYNRQLGQPLDRAFTLDPSLPAINASVQRRSLDELTTIALRQRSELTELHAQAASLGHLAAVEIARTRPQVSLSGGYTYLESAILDRDTFATASVGFTWPIFDGAAQHRVSALRGAQRSIEQRRADLESRIALEIQEAVLELEAATSRIGATTDAISQAEENLRITREQYRAGLVTSTRVLEAVTLRIEARTNHDDALLDAQLAGYRLLHSVGEL